MDDLKAVPAARLRQLGRQSYVPVWRAMQGFTDLERLGDDRLLDHSKIRLVEPFSRGAVAMGTLSFAVVRTGRGASR